MIITTSMTLAAAIALIASALAPFVTALLAREDLSPNRKRLIAGAVATVLGALTAVATGQLTGVPQGVIDWLAWALVSIGIVISLAQGFYQAFKGTTANLKAAVRQTPAAVEAAAVEAAPKAYDPKYDQGPEGDAL